MSEKESDDLQKLPKDFYVEAADYIQRIQQESKMLDKRSLKAKLSTRELSYVTRLIEELTRLRVQKLTDSSAIGDYSHQSNLQQPEEQISHAIQTSLEGFNTFMRELLKGKILPVEEIEKTPGRMMLRFIKEIPVIVGADLKTYGPFQVEDVAALPIENARVLVRQGVATEIEIR